MNRTSDLSFAKPAVRLLPVAASWTLGAALVFGAAGAQAADSRAWVVATSASAPAPAPAFARQTPWPGRAGVLVLTSARNSFAVPYAQTGPSLPAGVAQTAVDHRFDGDAGVVGSAGFLCGLQATRDGGAAEARGSDPSGRFLGAKLSLPFH